MITVDRNCCADSGPGDLSAQGPRKSRPAIGCPWRCFQHVHRKPTCPTGLGLDIPAGMHLRMNGPKKVIDAIDAYKDSMIQITGIMKKGQYGPGGVAIGGVRIAPGASPSGGSSFADPAAGQVQIDVEGWSPVLGSCPAK